jgi:hypothetical protein
LRNYYTKVYLVKKKQNRWWRNLPKRHHQGHEDTRRKALKPEAFVILRALGGL